MVESLPFELLPPTESFLPLSELGVLRPLTMDPVSGPAGAGLGATEEEAVEAEGGLELRSPFIADFVRPAACTKEEVLVGLPIEGVRSVLPVVCVKKIKIFKMLRISNQTQTKKCNI